MSAADERARWYDPAPDGYDLAADPRCLYGWGPPEHGCDCRSGHACFRAYGHPGKCWDAGGPLEPVKDRLKCAAVQRPKDWDSRDREANRVYKDRGSFVCEVCGEVRAKASKARHLAWHDRSEPGDEFQNPKD